MVGSKLLASFYLTGFRITSYGIHGKAYSCLQAPSSIKEIDREILESLPHKLHESNLAEDRL